MSALSRRWFFGMAAAAPVVASDQAYSRVDFKAPIDGCELNALIGENLNAREVLRDLLARHTLTLASEKEQRRRAPDERAAWRRSLRDQGLSEEVIRSYGLILPEDEPRSSAELLLRQHDRLDPAALPGVGRDGEADRGRAA